MDKKHCGTNYAALFNKIADELDSEKKLKKVLKRPYSKNTYAEVFNEICCMLDKKKRGA